MSSHDAEEQQDISNLQENFNKQQKKISALKELVRKSEVAHGKSTSTAQEKVKNIAQRLTHLKSKARSRQSLDVAQSDTTTTETYDATDASEQLSVSLPPMIDVTPMVPQLTTNMYSTPNPTPLKASQLSASNTSLTTVMNVTPGSEKIQLMRQQMEQNKLRMAQRASSKQHLEQLVTQLKEKFDTTQQCLEDTSELGRSMNDLSVLAYTPVTRERHKSVTDLSAQPFNLERERIKFLENRCRLLEKQLEKEKQSNSTSIAEANTKRLKELENKILELEAALEQRPMVVSEVKASELAAFEADELALENERLQNELADKLKQIANLEEINDMLETTRSDLTTKNNTQDEQLREELQQALRKLHETDQKLQETEQCLQESSAKCIVLQDTLEKLQNSTEASVVVVEKSKDTDAQIKAEMAKQIQSLTDELEQLRERNSALEQQLSENEKLEVSDTAIADKLAALEATIESQREDIQQHLEAANRYEEEVMEKTIELNVLNANFKVLEEKLQSSNKNKPLFSATAEDTAHNTEILAELQQLKQKLDESNKAMIKLKLKCKQTEKQMEKLRKSSDLHADVVRLEKEQLELQQKITELEDEKGQWQLQQVGSESDSAEEPTPQTQAQELVAELQEKCKVQTETIRLLEEQKFEYTQQLQTTQSELTTLQQHFCVKDKEETERVVSEINEIQLEEQLAQQTRTVAELQTQLADSDARIATLSQQLEQLQQAKQENDKKLEHYMGENMELIEKVDKLSKSSSSAESIEIVERLTQQERAEIDEYNKRLDQEQDDEEHNETHAEKALTASSSELTQTGNATEMGQELSDSLAKLREESSELMNKIELFTNERREVLEKMELLKTENQELLSKIEELSEEKQQFETNAMLADNAKSQLEQKLQEVSREKELLASQVAESTAQKAQLSQELSTLQQCTEVVAALEDGATLFDKCEKSLSKLNSELEAYRKANDKNAKFNASKKLAKEAKNAYTQLSELLQKVKESSSAVETVTVVETVVAVTAPNGKALAEYEQLTAQNRELKATVSDLRRELQEAREDTRESTVQITEIMPQAITQEQDVKLREQQEAMARQLAEYEEQCAQLQTTVEDLRLQLQEARLAGDEHAQRVTSLTDELESMRKMSEDFDRLINDKEMSHEKQVEHLTRLRKELEAKCETYEGEMEILQTLITEQKQQLIEAYKESEHELNMKVLDLQQRDEQIAELRSELQMLKESSAAVGEQFVENLQRECDKLKESMKINKNLVAEQVNELSNKQETIDSLNQQIIDLYKTMEENANSVIEKDDEIAYLQELLENNTKQLTIIQKDKDEQNSVVDKLLGELHSHKSQQLPQLEADIRRLEQRSQELAESNKSLEQNNNKLEQEKKTLEQRNKDTMDKLKKYAANLRKRAAQCQEYETKIKDLEKGAVEALQTKETENESQKLADAIEKIAALEALLQETQHEAEVIKEAIQSKTLELLEAMEQNTLLTNELHAAENKLTQKALEVEQLQNALAASQDQMSDWGDATLNNANAESLTQELTDKTASLERAELALSEVQNELLQIQETEKERQEAALEMQEALDQQTKLVKTLQDKLDEATVATSNLNAQLQEQEQSLNRVSEELKAKAIKFEKSKAVIKERNNQIHRLQAELKDLQTQLVAQPEELPVDSPLMQSSPIAPPISNEQHASLQEAYDKLNEHYHAEKSQFQQTTARLETLHDGIQAKLQEDMAYIESLEQENAKYKEKICKLEECVGSFEERRASMERRANLLDEEMQSRVDEFEKSEDALVYRLNMLSDHDDVIGQRLIKSQEEKEEIQEKLQQMQEQLHNLKTEHTNLEQEYRTYKEESNINIDAEIVALKEKLAASEHDLQRLRATSDAQLASKTTELDELECELGEQLSNMNAEKRALNEELERSRDECTEQKDEVVRLKETLNALEQSKSELERESTWLRMQQESAQQDQYELQELRMQTLQDKTEIDNLRSQIESLAANHDIELQGLRTQISELDTLRMQVGQNQTDDQVFIETENKRLTDLLAEKESIIENYQRQNLQLQLAAVAAASAPSAQPDPFALAFGLPPPNPSSMPAAPQSTELEQRLERLEHDLADKIELAARVQRDFNSLQSEYHSLHESNLEMQRQLSDKQRELDAVRMPQRTQQPHSALSSEIIPAPPLFFANEQMIPSPFDDIVPTRAMDTYAVDTGAPRRHGSVDALVSEEQPTIEDLQRNVSDLEKHAQDLENKLLLRNQRDGELEDRMRDAQERLRVAELQLQERDEQQQRLATEQQHWLDQQQSQQQILQQETQQHVTDLKAQLSYSELQIQELQLRLEQLQQQQLLQQTLDSQISSQAQQASDTQLQELQTKLQQFENMLKERDEQLKQLQRREEETQLKSCVEQLEQQIIPTPSPFDAAMAAAAPTLDMFFGASHAPEFEQLIIPQVCSEPVVEELIVAKKAYVCQPPECAGGDATAAQTVFELTDDWGDSWGGQEAAAEAEHYATNTTAVTSAKHSLITREQQLEIELQEQQDRIKELQLAQDRSEQQKQELQLKSGKLMKKLKEYKVKLEELQQQQQTSSTSRPSNAMDSMFDNLDAAIQEELRTQIAQLELRLTEHRKQQDAQQLEREKLLKRVDTLTAGNERMTELKERQDMDVQMYQARIRELQQKLNSLEDWGGADEDKHDAKSTEIEKTQVVISPLVTNPAETTDGNASLAVQQTIEELRAELHDSNGDRQELQALLEEEKANAERAEQKVQQLQQQLSLREQEEKSGHNELKLQHQQLQERCYEMQEEHSKLQEEQTKLSQTWEAERELKMLELLELRAKLEELQKSPQTSKELEQLQLQHVALQQTLETQEQQLNEAQAQLLTVRTRTDELLQANAELETQLAILAQEKGELLQTQNVLEQQLTELQASTSLKPQNSNNTDELCAQLQEQESEIVHLKQRIEDLMREDQTEKLVLEILTKNQELHMLKMQVRQLEEDKQELEHNLTLQITKELQDSNNKELKQSPITERSETNVDDNEVRRLQTELQTQNKRVRELEDERAHMENELQVLNNHVLSSLELEDQLKASVLQLDTRNIEIAELRKSLQTLQQSGAEAKVAETDAATVPAVDVAALNAQWETHVEQKCGEIAQMWRAHLEQREQDFKLSETKMQQEIETLQATIEAASTEAATHTAAHQQQQQQQQDALASAESSAATSSAAESSSSVSRSSSVAASKESTPLRRHTTNRIINETSEAEADDDELIEKMQSALESQEMEIVTLKEQLAIRSAEYARLAAQYDPFKLQTTLSHSGMSATTQESPMTASQRRQSQAAASVNDNNVVPKSELDLALYMLHQRDMRCEEMTLELVSLLEERDTLQLKLSNTLRQVETIRTQAVEVATNISTDAADVTDATTIESSLKATTAAAAATAAENTTADAASNALLSQKLSQLHSVSHAKDKVIKEERDQRIRQMEQIQQDIAKMPSAAVSELVGSDFSQSNQSPSTVLLNWLWGNKPSGAGGASPSS